MERLFTSLCAQIDGGHLANAIKTCDKILRLEPNDTLAFQTKLYLLLQTDQYLSALALIDKASENTANASQYAFQRAYAMYRLHREEDTAEILKSIKDNKKDEDGKEEDRAVLHLEAQLCYRQGSYQAAFDLYNQLLDTAQVHSEEHSDILTNLQASQRHLDFITTDYLHALDTLPSSLSANLESLPPPQPSKTLFSPSMPLTTSAAPQTQNSQTPPSKPPRASRLPKHVVPGQTPPPDPERWLKKSERSTFGTGTRKRGGRGPTGGGGATQGSVGVGGESAATSVSHGNVKSGGKGKKKR